MPPYYSLSVVPDILTVRTDISCRNSRMHGLPTVRALHYFSVILLHYYTEMLSAMNLFPCVGTEDKAQWILDWDFEVRICRSVKVINSSAMHVDRTHIGYILYFV